MSRSRTRFLRFAAFLGGAIAMMAVDAVDPPSCNPVPVQCTEGTPCDDWDACTTGEMCVAGECVGGQAVVCDDADPCTDDMCDPIQGCYAEPVDCDDGFECSIDGCDALAGCAHDYTPCNPALLVPGATSWAESPGPWPDAHQLERCASIDFTLEGFAIISSLDWAPEPIDYHIADIAGGPALYLEWADDEMNLVCEQQINPWSPGSPRQRWVVDLRQAGVYPYDEWHHYACAGYPGGILDPLYVWVDGVPVVANFEPYLVGQDPDRPAITMGYFNGSGFAYYPSYIDGVRFSETILYPPEGAFQPPPDRWAAPRREACAVWNFNYAPGTTEMLDEMRGLPLLGVDASVQIPPPF